MTKSMGATVEVSKISIGAARNFWKATTSSALIILALLINIFFSDEIAHSVRSGLMLCANVIIPSVFPFIILSDFLLHSINFSSLRPLGYLFRKTFNINSAALPAFLLGLLCGFPLGVRCAVSLYEDGRISREECERLIGFSNNTGPAFLISGIGLGLRGNVIEGVILYVSMTLSALICGFVFGFGRKCSEDSGDIIQKYPFSLTDSIKNAGLNTLNICSYLTFFALFCGLLKKALGVSLPYLLLIPFLEVGSAASILSKATLLPPAVSLALTSLAVGFSGFCVHMQAMSFIRPARLGCKKYFCMKLFQGAISFSLTTAFIYLFL